MARPLRPAYPGAIYHITVRGVERRRIFMDDRDREGFLGLLADVVARFEWRCHAYCLMTNHFHLVVETPLGNVSAGMKQLNGVYAQAFNRRHGRRGHLYEDRFHTTLVETEAHLLELTRYVPANPVRARLCRAPGQWRWSSYAATAGDAPAPRFLTVDWTLAQFAAGPERARVRYRLFVAEGLRVATSSPGTSQTTPSGGSVTAAENGWSCQATSSATTAPSLPTSEPP